MSPTLHKHPSEPQTLNLLTYIRANGFGQKTPTFWLMCDGKTYSKMVMTCRCDTQMGAIFLKIGSVTQYNVHAPEKVRYYVLRTICIRNDPKCAVIPYLFLNVHF